MNLTSLIRKFCNNHHNMFTNGLLMANILASAPTTIRIRIEEGDRPTSIAVENINRAIKADASRCNEMTFPLKFMKIHYFSQIEVDYSLKVSI